MVAQRFRACVKFKWMLTQRPWFKSRSRHENLYGQIYMVTIAPAVIVVLLYSLCRGNTILITQSQKWLVTVQKVGCRVALPLTLSSQVKKKTRAFNQNSRYYLSVIIFFRHSIFFLLFCHRKYVWYLNIPLFMSPLSLVFNTIVTVKLISKMYFEQTHLFLILL